MIIKAKNPKIKCVLLQLLKIINIYNYNIMNNIIIQYYIKKMIMTKLQWERILIMSTKLYDHLIF